MWISDGRSTGQLVRGNNVPGGKGSTTPLRTAECQNFNDDVIPIVTPFAFCPGERARGM